MKVTEIVASNEGHGDCCVGWRSRGLLCGMKVMGCALDEGHGDCVGCRSRGLLCGMKVTQIVDGMKVMWFAWDEGHEDDV